MEDIKELVTIINKRKLSQIDMLDKSLISGKDTLLTKFYHLIINNNIETDKQAMQLLYGNSASSDAYRKLKSTFKSRLLNTLYFLDTKNDINTIPIKRLYAGCLNKLYLCNILLKYNHNSNASVKLILDNYTVAKKNNFYDILKEFSFKLLVHYGMTGEEKKYHKEKIAYDNYVTEYENEQAAQIIYSKVYLLSSSVKRNQHEKLKEIEIEIKDNEKILKRSNSLLVFFILTRNNLFYYEIIGNNQKINETCDRFINEHHHYQHSIFKEGYLNTVFLYKIKCLFDLRKYDEMLLSTSKMLPNAPRLNILSAQEFMLKTYLNLKNADKAMDFIREVLHSSAYKNSTKIVKERWLLFEAYVNFFYCFMENKPYKYSTAKLYNQIPGLIQDKSGLNLSVRIIDILFLIGKNNLDAAATKIDSLSTYQNRYLKESIYLRSSLFLKLLQIMEKKSFNYKNLKYVKEYTSLKENFSNQIINDNEFIFFDQLWEIILNMLEQNDKRILDKVL